MNAATATPLRLHLTPDLQYLLRWADTALVHAQRLSEWCGHAPVLEEDIALTNMALDLLGQARALLTHAAALHGQGLDEDMLAYWREHDQFFNLTLVEQPLRKPGAHAPGGDFADTVLRNFVLATWLKAAWAALQTSRDDTLAGIAAKSLKEARYHQQHNADWVQRLGDGTEASARRMAAAVQRLWPYTAEMFEHDTVDEAALASSLGPARADLRTAWHAEVAEVFAAAGLGVPADTPFRSTGTQGRHSEHLGYLLAEMQVLQRQHPGGRW